MFFSIAWRNAKRSRSENLIYFLTMVTAIATFYIVLSLGEQDVICKSLYTAVRTLCNQYFVFQLDVHSMWHCGFCSLRSYSHEGAKEHRK